MADVTHIASAVANEANPTTTFTVTIPASAEAGDDLYLSVMSRNSSTDPTVVDDDTGGNTWSVFGNTGTNGLSIWWKKATSGSANKTITVDGCVNSAAGGVSVYRGGAAGDPTTNVSIELNAGGDETHAGFTPDNADSMICLTVGQRANDNAVSSQTCTDPGALTQRFENLSIGGSDTGCNHSSAPQVGGPTATDDFTWAQTNGATNSVVWAIKPAADTPVSNVAAVNLEALTGPAASRSPLLEAMISVAQGRAANLESQTGVAQPRAALLENLLSASRAVSADLEALQGLAADRTVNLEALTSEVAVSATAALLFEALIFLAAERTANLESPAGVAQTPAPPLEALAGVSQPANAWLEALGWAAAARGISLEALQQLAPSRAALLESLAFVAQARAGNAEALLGVAAGRAVNLESLGELLISMTAAIPLEALSDTGAPRILSLETLAPAARTAALTIEALTHVAQPRAGQFEAVALVRFAPAPNLEGLAAASGGLLSNLEGLAAVSGTAVLPLEVLQAIARATGIPFEAMQGGIVNIVVNVVERIAYFQVTLPTEARFAAARTETARVASTRPIEVKF
jgi:hypothetical protein